MHAEATGGSEHVLRIEGLRTSFFTDRGEIRAVAGLDLSVTEGRTTCIVGESGSGKSVAGRSILQLVDPPGRITGGKVMWRSTARTPADGLFNGKSRITQADVDWQDLLDLDPRGEMMRRVRGSEIGMVFQEPMASLSPIYTVGKQLTEAIRIHERVSKLEARDRALQLLERVGIPQPVRHFDAYPFQMSGGMCQRVMIAIAISCHPSLLIADEPTTALDVTTQARILELLKELQDEMGMAIIFITHDLGVVAQIADDVAVMYLGQIVEQGPVQEIFSDPRHPYTRALLESIPTAGRGRRLAAIRGTVPAPNERPAGCSFHPRCDYAIAGLCDETSPIDVLVNEEHMVSCLLYESDRGATGVSLQALVRTREDVEVATSSAPLGRGGTVTHGVPGLDPLLEVSGLTMRFPGRRQLFGGRTSEVQALRGVDLSLRAGETLGIVGESGSGKTTMGRCIARIIAPSSGSIMYRTADTVLNLAALTPTELRPYYQQIRMIFQDPYSSLNPRMTIGQIVAEPLRNLGMASGSEAEDRVVQMLGKVGLRSEHADRYPHAFSGGQRQRVNIARALITGPQIVIADEAVSALDVSVRAQILNLLQDLQDEYGLTYIFISHDLSVVEHVCDRIAVMYLGAIAETAPTARLYASPRHPYTESLLRAIPVPDPAIARSQRARSTSDEIPDPASAPPGCTFHPRCPYADGSACSTEAPDLIEVGESDMVACHLADRLTLAGLGSSGSLRIRPGLGHELQEVSLPSDDESPGSTR